jgi:hypothetical protein
MSRPPRVPYSAAAGSVRIGHMIKQVLNLTFFFENGEFILVLVDRYSSAVVSAILKSLQPFDDDGKRFLIS